MIMGRDGESQFLFRRVGSIKKTEQPERDCLPVTYLDAVGGNIGVLKVFDLAALFGATTHLENKFTNSEVSFFGIGDGHCGACLVDKKALPDAADVTSG